MLAVDLEREVYKDPEVLKEKKVFWDPQVSMDKMGNEECKELLVTKDQLEKQVVKDPEVYRGGRVCPE